MLLNNHSAKPLTKEDYVSFEGPDKWAMVPDICCVCMIFWTKCVCNVPFFQHMGRLNCFCDPPVDYIRYSNI